MRILIVLLSTTLLFASCGNGNQKKPVEQMDASTVYVYYFHGKQRCKTCIAVGNVTKQTIADLYNGNSKVKYMEVKTDEKVNEHLVDKYEVSWNALIIAKGDHHVDITNDAFATAVNSPGVLAGQIETEVNKFLE